MAYRESREFPEPGENWGSLEHVGRLEFLASGVTAGTREVMVMRVRKVEEVTLGSRVRRDLRVRLGAAQHPV